MIAIAVVKRALVVARATVAAHVGLLVSIALTLCALTAGADEVFDRMRHAQYAASSPDERVFLAFINAVLVVSTAFVWSFLSSVQRAATIALSDDGGARTGIRNAFRARQGRAVMTMALLLAFADCALLIGVSVLLYGIIHAERSNGSTLAWCLLAWIPLRALIGTAMATVVVDEQTPVAAMRASVRALEGHRWAISVTRAVPLVFAAVAAASSGHLETPHVYFVAIVMSPIVVAIDATLEAAWHAELARVPVDPTSVASAFE